MQYSHSFDQDAETNVEMSKTISSLVHTALVAMLGSNPSSRTHVIATCSYSVNIELFSRCSHPIFSKKKKKKKQTHYSLYNERF